MPPLWGHFLYPYRSADRVSPTLLGTSPHKVGQPSYKVGQPSQIIALLSPLLPFFTQHIVPERVYFILYSVKLSPIGCKMFIILPPQTQQLPIPHCEVSGVGFWRLEARIPRTTRRSRPSNV